MNEYLGPIHGEAVIGANVIKDVSAGVRDIVGGRSGSYQKAIDTARDAAFEDPLVEAEELGANAVVAVDYDYEELRGRMIWVNVTGTAVRVE